MRTDISAREDIETQTALLEALAAVGAVPDDDTAAELPLSVGLHRYTAPEGTLTVFADAWGVDLEGPDELVRRVLAAMSATG
jgi:hypothetical protein